MMADRMMATPMKKGGHADAAEDRAMIKKAMSGKKFASGGGVTSMMTKTTVPDSVATPYATTAVRSTPNGRTNMTTGEIKESNGGGYKRGGKVMMKSAGGGSGTLPASGVKPYDQTMMHTAPNGKTNGTTGDVKMGNGAGFKRGGKIKMDTGGVANTNAGGYKMGGKTSKKAYATGGTVDTGKPVALFHGNVHSGPKTQNSLSGVYKDGGKVTGNTIPNKRLRNESDKENAATTYDKNLDSLYKYKEFPQSIKTAKSGDNRASKKVTPQYR